MGLTLIFLSHFAVAENLMQVKSSVLRSLADPNNENRLLVVGGHIVALNALSGFVYRDSSDQWEALAEGWRHTNVQAVIPHNDGVYLISEAEDIVSGPRIEHLALSGDQLVRFSLTPLPVPLAFVQGAVWAGRLFVTGIDADGEGRLLVLNVATPFLDWSSHPIWENADSQPTSLIVQDQTLFVTLRNQESGIDNLLRWNPESGWLLVGTVPGSVIHSTARSIGQGHILYILETPRNSKPTLVSFHTVTGSFNVLQETDIQLASGGASWRNGMLLSVHDAGVMGVRFLELETTQNLIGFLDWAVLGLYLSAMLSIGLYFFRREKNRSTEDFFVGGRSIPFWAAGISLYATNASSISYIAIPAKAFATNWQYLMNNMVAAVALLFVAVWIVPLLRRLDLMSVFHYLETRFHSSIRMIASGLSIAMQLGGRMSVVLFLPSLAISTITGLDVVWSILMMGMITICYTALGGMKAVIWTDCVQLIVMFGGAIFAIGFIIAKLDGGMAEFFIIATADDKTRLMDWSFDLTKATVWGFVFLVVFDVVLTFPKDQVLMQRVLSTKSSAEAKRSIWTFAAIMVPSGFIFYLIGTALYVFYKTHPERMNPLLTTDATFPLFIAAELPTGVTGIIIAGIVAASMSTLSSILNSVATLASIDFYDKLNRKRKPDSGVRVAKWMTVGGGLIGMGLALALSRFDINSFFDVSIQLSGLLSGGFAGAYTLGMFTRRANWQGVVIGIATSIVLTVWAWTQNLVHPYFYMPISIFICIVIGYVFSFLFPAPAHSLAGLTIFSEKADFATTAD